MADTIYLDINDVHELHVEQIKHYGGAPGVRDAGLIEAALQRPQTGYYRDLIEEAASMWESLTMNYGFVDGNKRVGVAASYVFLRVNGYQWTAQPQELETLVLSNLEAGTFTKDVIDAWLRDNTATAE